MINRQIISNYISRYIVELLLVCFFVILTYGYEISNWTMTIDEEINSNIERYTSFVGWSTQGRWGIGLLKLILPTYKILPFWNGFMAITLLIVATLYICKIVDWFDVGTTGHSVVIMSYICMPLHSFYLMFDTYSVEVSLGILLALISGHKIITYFLHTHEKKDLIIGLLCLIYAIGIYQLLLQIYICIVCVGLLAYICDNGITLKKFIIVIFKTIFVLIIGIVVYLIIGKIIQTSFCATDGYIDSFIRWGNIDTKLVLSFIKEQLQIMYIEPNKLFVGGNVLLLVYAFLVISMISMIVKKRECTIKIIICYFGMLLSISIGIIALGGPVPLRTHQAIPVFTSLVLAIGTKYIFQLKDSCTVKVILFFILASVFLNQSARVVELYYSENNRQNRDMMLTNNIAEEIIELDLGVCPQYPVVFLGYPETLQGNLQKEELFSSSMLTSGEVRRTYLYFALQGYEYIMPNEAERKKAETLAIDKPVWPYDGSVFFEDNMVIVKFATEY